MKPTRNFVAKHARTFNKPTVQVDRKKAARKGYIKHKKPGAAGLLSVGRRLFQSGSAYQHVTSCFFLPRG